MKTVGIPIILWLCLAACAEQPRVHTARTIPGTVVAKHVTNGLNQDLAAFALSDAALSESVVAEVVRTDPGYAEFVRYMLECALPADASIDFGDGNVFHGAIGLAPEWLDGPCGVACQEWVTACLGARSNAYGVTVDITMDSTAEAIGVGSDKPVEEGAYYGNIFEPLPRFYACRGAGYDPLMMIFRACSQPDGGCGMQWVGPCSARDGDTGVVSERVACEPAPADGSYRTCWNRPTQPGASVPAEPFRAYTRIIRVTVHQTGFTPGCERSPWDPSAAARPDPYAANLCEPDGPTDLTCLGTRCKNDDGCGGESYVCDVLGPIQTCSAGCASSADQADEAAQCGGAKTTCMGVFGDSDPSNGRCGVRCAPVGQAGYRCPPSHTCTGSWFNQPDGTSDVPGCLPVCESDADCAYGVCNPRFMGCATEPVDMTKKRDGEPCNPTEADPAPCRGSCTAVDGAPSGGGLCASFIDWADTKECPDDPETMLPSGPVGQDDALICIYRGCEDDDDCTPPLTCKASGFSGRCLY